MHGSPKASKSRKYIKMRHWSRNLEDVGKPILWKADSIEQLEAEKFQLQRKITELDQRIQKEERELFDLVKNDWSEEEIQVAKINSSIEEAE